MHSTRISTIGYLVFQISACGQSLAMRLDASHSTVPSHPTAFAPVTPTQASHLRYISERSVSSVNHKSLGSSYPERRDPKPRNVKKRAKSNKKKYSCPSQKSQQYRVREKLGGIDGKVEDPTHAVDSKAPGAIYHDAPSGHVQLPDAPVGDTKPHGAPTGDANPHAAPPGDAIPHMAPPGVTEPHVTVNPNVPETQVVVTTPHGAPSGNGHSGGVTSGDNKSGDATYYATGLGACGHVNSDDHMIAAVSHLLFDTFPGATANPNLNPICGRKVKATYEGKSVEVQIVDRCTGCALHDLDFSPTAFSQLGNMERGRLHGMTWEWM